MLLHDFGSSAGAVGEGGDLDGHAAGLCHLLSYQVTLVGLAGTAD